MVDTDTYYSRVEYIFGGSKIFTVPFNYIKISDLHVYINDLETKNFVFNTKTQIEIKDNLIQGDIVKVERNTPIDEKLITFSNTSFLNKEAQNTAQDQLLHAVQEIYDSFGRYRDTIGKDIDEVLEAKNKLDETIEEWQKTLDLCKSYRDESEQYAETCTTGVKWFYFTQNSWGQEEDKYYITIDGKSVVFDIYKKFENGREKIFNCDIFTTDNGVKITSPEAFEGYAIIAANTIGEYVFVQTNPQTEWIAEHNLGKYPSVTLVDSNESIIYGDVQYLDLNTIKITFKKDVAGKAYLN